MLSWISDPNAWLALLTLSALEVVLGIDNVIFISILAGKLPLAKQARARHRGLDDTVARLLVHGVLHLLGHDHEEDGQARRMLAEERRIWRVLDA